MIATFYLSFGQIRRYKHKSSILVAKSYNRIVATADSFVSEMAKTKRKGKTQEIAKSAMTILKTKLTGRLNPRTDNEAIFFFFIYY